MKNQNVWSLCKKYGSMICKLSQHNCLVPLVHSIIVHIDLSLRLKLLPEYSENCQSTNVSLKLFFPSEVSHKCVCYKGFIIHRSNTQWGGAINALHTGNQHNMNWCNNCSTFWYLGFIAKNLDLQKCLEIRIHPLPMNEGCMSVWARVQTIIYFFIFLGPTLQSPVHIPKVWCFCEVWVHVHKSPSLQPENSPKLEGWLLGNRLWA